MAIRKVIAGLGLVALALAGGCRTTTVQRPVYGPPVVVGSAPVVQPVAPGPCCNGGPAPAVPAQPPIVNPVPVPPPPR